MIFDQCWNIGHAYLFCRRNVFYFSRKQILSGNGLVLNYLEPVWVISNSITSEFQWRFHWNDVSTEKADALNAVALTTKDRDNIFFTKPARVSYQTHKYLGKFCKM
jgi:hypothetical protein